MNKILFVVLILMLTLHFFLKETPKFTPFESEQNLSLSKPNIAEFDKNDGISEPEFTPFESESNVFTPKEQAQDEDEPSLDSILPNIKELIKQLNPDDKSFVVSNKNLFPHIKEQELFIDKKTPTQSYLDTSELPQTPNLSQKDFNFKGSNLAKRLFEPNANGKKLWQNALNWELWKKNERANKSIYTLLGGFYLYQNEQNEGYLSDEISISLQKSRKNAYFISIITPQSYENKLIQDYKSLDDYFIFKIGERKFIIAYLFNRDFTLWWECELTSRGLKSTPIASNAGFSVYSSDTNAYEMRLSENETH